MEDWPTFLVTCLVVESTNLVSESELARTVRERRNAPPDLSPARLDKLRVTYDPTLQRLVPELKPQAHFVDYAPPSFIAFHNGAYLQLSMNTDLEQPAGSSQYRIAAMAFESHISHVLRPVTKYFMTTPSLMAWISVRRSISLASLVTSQWSLWFRLQLCFAMRNTIARGRS
jgi:hypothetical protein